MCNYITKSGSMLFFLFARFWQVLNRYVYQSENGFYIVYTAKSDQWLQRRYLSWTAFCGMMDR